MKKIITFLVLLSFIMLIIPTNTITVIATDGTLWHKVYTHDLGQAACRQLRISHDETMLAYIQAYNQVGQEEWLIVLDLTSTDLNGQYNVLYQYSFGTTQEPVTLEWSLDDNYIAVGRSNDSCYIFDVSDTNSDNWFYHRSITGGKNSIAWMTDFLATSSYNGFTYVYHKNNFTEVFFTGFDGSLVINPDNNNQLCIAGYDVGQYNIRIYEPFYVGKSDFTAYEYRNTLESSALSTSKSVWVNDEIYVMEHYNDLNKYSDNLQTKYNLLDGKDSTDEHNYINFDVSNNGDVIALGHATNGSVYINTTGYGGVSCGQVDYFSTDADEDHYIKDIVFHSNGSLFLSDYYNGYGTDENMYIFTNDDYDAETYGEETEDDFIIVKLYDIETGNQLEYFESPFVGPIYTTSNMVWGKFYINDEEMTVNSSYLLDEDRLEIQLISDDLELGDTNTLEFRGYTTSNNPRGAVNGVYTTFTNYTTTKILYSGNTYNIYLTPIDFTTETQENIEEYTGTELYWYLSTDKYNYTTGEQLILKYKLPSKFELADNGGVPDSGYQITIHKEGISWWDRFWGDYSGTAEYITTEALVYGEYAYLYIDVNDLNPEEGVTNYEINIFSPDQGPFWVRINPTGDPDGLWFRVVNGTLTPTGSISSLDPSEPKIGENVNISFTANNRGMLTYEELNDVTENEYTITLFEKPTGTAYAYTAFWNPSTYIIREYIWNGYEYVEVDNEFLYVNTSGQNYSGYNVEYMQISKDRYIAGYSHAEIAYKSLGNNATFTITTPKGETSRYSTVLPAGEGVYRFFISQDSPIGRYNVTFKGQETFESYFYVVYDENNYVEFGKHSYYEDEAFDVYLKFDTRMGLIFKKENSLGNYVPQGQTIFFEKGLEIGYKNIPRNIITPSEGNWRVEMWEVNNRVPIRLKATHDCIVIPRPATEPILEPVESDLLPPIDGVLGAIVGLIITLFCTLSPFILIKGLKAKQNPPAITYAIAGGTGIVVSVILGFFPFFVLPFILIAGIIILLMQYVVNNKGGNGGE